jgi:5'-nucleotidase
VRILVTNDDGWEAPGILALATALHEAGHEILVVAPNDDRSGAGASIGRLHRAEPMPVAEERWPELPDVRVLVLDLPPAAGVYIACLGAFGDPPELVASGVNPGANTGHLVLHSGTVGAALTAAGLGVPGLAVSIAWGDDPLFSTAAALAVPAVEWMVQPTDGPARALNLNAPNLPIDDVLGVREASLAPYGEVWVATADFADGALKLDFQGRDHEPDPGTDLALVHAGYAAVTPLISIGRRALDGAADTIAAALPQTTRT